MQNLVLNIFNLRKCAICQRDYKNCRIGKSKFYYFHPEIEEAKDGICYKVCKHCRRTHHLNEIMRELLQPLQSGDKQND